MAVFEYVLKDKITYVNADRLFKFPFSNNAKQLIIDMWSSYKKCKLFNSDSVSVIDIQRKNNEDIVVLAKTDFYSLLITNIIRSQVKSFNEFVNSEYHDKEHLKAMEELLLFYATLAECNSFIDLIKNGGLSNTLAISLQVVDRFGNALFTKRTSKVGIGQNMYSVTVTGTVDVNDLKADDPIKCCACRELKEELNLDISPESINLISFVAGIDKKQPIAIMTASVDFNLKTQLMNVHEGIDFTFEVEKAFVCKIKQIKDLLDSQEFSEAADYHLRMFI